MMLEHFQVPAADQVRVPEAALRQTVPSIFAKMGLSHEDGSVTQRMLADQGLLRNII